MAMEIEKEALSPIRFSFDHPVLIRSFFAEIQAQEEKRDAEPGKKLKKQNRVSHMKQ